MRVIFEVIVLPKNLKLEKVLEILLKFVERKGNGKECCPLWVWWKGKGKLSNFDWKERKYFPKKMDRLTCMSTIAQKDAKYLKIAHSVTSNRRI